MKVRALNDSCTSFILSLNDVHVAVIGRYPPDDIEEFISKYLPWVSVITLSGCFLPSLLFIRSILLLQHHDDFTLLLATGPTISYGRVLLMSHDDKLQLESFSLPITTSSSNASRTLDSTWYDRHWNPKFTIAGLCTETRVSERMSITAVSSGYDIGSCNWRIQSQSTVVSIVGASSSAQEYRVPKSLDIDDLKVSKKVKSSNVPNSHVLILSDTTVNTSMTLAQMLDEFSQTIAMKMNCSNNNSQSNHHVITYDNNIASLFDILSCINNVFNTTQPILSSSKVVLLMNNHSAFEQALMLHPEWMSSSFNIMKDLINQKKIVVVSSLSDLNELYYLENKVLGDTTTTRPLLYVLPESDNTSLFTEKVISSNSIIDARLSTTEAQELLMFSNPDIVVVPQDSIQLNNNNSTTVVMKKGVGADIAASKDDLAFLSGSLTAELASSIYLISFCDVCFGSFEAFVKHSDGEASMLKLVGRPSSNSSSSVKLEKLAARFYKDDNGTTPQQHELIQSFQSVLAQNGYPSVADTENSTGAIRVYIKRINTTLVFHPPSTTLSSSGVGNQATATTALTSSFTEIRIADDSGFVSNEDALHSLDSIIQMYANTMELIQI